METGLLKREVRRAARGDRDAAAALFDHYHPRVYRYALAKLSKPVEAEDVAAETFARVLRDLDGFRWKGAGFEAWVFRIAANLVVDVVRASGREQLGDDTTEELEAVAPTPEQMAMYRETTEEMDELLATLPPDQREVLLLRFAGGLGTEETGRVMKRRANAVRQLQFRALQNLRERIQTREEIS